MCLLFKIVRKMAKWMSRIMCIGVLDSEWHVLPNLNICHLPDKWVQKTIRNLLQKRQIILEQLH